MGVVVAVTYLRTERRGDKPACQIFGGSNLFGLGTGILHSYGHFDKKVALLNKCF